MRKTQFPGYGHPEKPGTQQNSEIDNTQGYQPTYVTCIKVFVLFMLALLVLIAKRIERHKNKIARKPEAAKCNCNF